MDVYAQDEEDIWLCTWHSMTGRWTQKCDKPRARDEVLGRLLLCEEHQQQMLFETGNYGERLPWRTG